MHIPVLLEEAIAGLNLRKGQVVVDATLGEGGHSREILEKIGKAGKLIAIDLDKESINKNKNKFSENEDQVYLINDNFSNLRNILEEVGVDKVDAILADLGWRMEQVEKSEYGMSFQTDGPLDMRMNDCSSENLTAGKIINEWDRGDLLEIFRKYGEERFSNEAVKNILIAREKKEIKTTVELAEILKKSLSRYYRNKRIHPATKIFQALRIVVNEELENLEKFLPQALNSLKKDGYLAVITFNSLEDRIVKKFFQTNARGCICPKEFPVCICGQKPKIKIVNSKPIISGEKELANNPRSRSAKLRLAQKL